ncbi:Oidioi.mRNA.OKI2018_I69.PAR.g10290.t1.cds [Oikopleura dioica]|uniref:Oidioi.mRNA.OKI2018_I69.PAR.g10290.t1.cds n=1 Tax=Oikopleura dioica TaxID=34765 RepID=A0ABN7RVQ6_OIKDI|nr:Oidioi.mRNA.OKI2018_I69.PAR.g10290.t1.cds [Oikopleura dioica]
MNRVHELRQRENRGSQPLAASSPRPGPPFGAPTPLFTGRRPVLMDKNGRDPSLDISSIPMSGERRGRLEAEDVPSVETFSADGIESPTIVQQSTGNVRQYISSLVAKKNKYKRMALEAKKAYEELSALVTEKLPVVDALEAGVNKMHDTVEAIKQRQYVFFTVLSLLAVFIYAVFVEMRAATATTNGSPYV